MDKDTAIKFYQKHKHLFDNGNYIFFMNDRDQLMYMFHTGEYGIVNNIRDATKDKPISVLKTNIKQLSAEEMNG